jgi:hypothetical protein
MFNKCDDYDLKGSHKTTSICIGDTPFLWYNIGQKFKLSLYLKHLTRCVQGNGGKDPCNSLKQIPLSFSVLRRLLFWLKSFTEFLSQYISNIHPQKSTPGVYHSKQGTGKERETAAADQMFHVAGSCDWNG